MSEHDDRAADSGPTYTIRVDPSDHDRVIVTFGSTSWRIHRDDADPKHRLRAYRLAAAWFGNSPSAQG